eukprot:755379-Hanusia_phi.AAC.6
MRGLGAGTGAGASGWRGGGGGAAAADHCSQRTSVESWDPKKSNILQVRTCLLPSSPLIYLSSPRLSPPLPSSPPSLLIAMQVLVSIQGLILVPEPFYNEPSYEQVAAKVKPSRRYRGTAEGVRASKQVGERGGRGEERRGEERRGGRERREEAKREVLTACCVAVQRERPPPHVAVDSHLLQEFSSTFQEA